MFEMAQDELKSLIGIWDFVGFGVLAVVAVVVFIERAAALRTVLDSGGRD